jgi:DNA repair protein RecN (Recombination protein N)
MLRAVQLRNLGVLERGEVHLGPGLTVVTGETGAGKSLLLDAIALLIGRRAESDCIRAGAEECVVEGLFEKTPKLSVRLLEAGLPDEGEVIAVRRTVGRSGRGRVHVNGALTSVGVLSRLFEDSVELMGQHAQLSLAQPGAQILIVDEAANLRKDGDVFSQYAACYARATHAEQRLLALGGDAEARVSKAEYLKFQIQEIETLNPLPDELASLEEERKRLASSMRLRTLVGQAESRLSCSEPSMSDELSRTMQALGEAAKIDARLLPLLQSVELARAQVDDTVRALSKYASSIEDDPSRLTAVEERIDALKRLAKKYALPAGGSAQKLESLKSELQALENHEQVRAHAEQEAGALKAQLDALGEALSVRRREAIAQLERRVLKQLKRLSMGQAILSIAQTRGKPGPDGADTIEFWFTANPGEAQRPLARVASGGELSRILLSIRASAQTESGVAGLLVLDEADAGVGGAAADEIGRLIHEVSASRQVLCVTHLAQVAAHADSHIAVSKQIQRGRTQSALKRFDSASDRAQELARMLSGDEVTAEAIGAAKALLKRASVPSRASRITKLAIVKNRNFHSEANASLPCA